MELRLSYGKKGLGPNSFGILRYLLPYNKLFYFASVTHDIGYSIGGDEFDKERIDKLFLKLCLIASNNKQLAQSFAILYHAMVREFGHYYFKYK